MGLRLNGSTSGYVELNAPATAGTTTLELPTDSIKPGMVLVAAQSFSAVSSVSVNNCFSATYENYRVLVHMTQGGGSQDQSAYLKLRASGTDSSASYWVANGTGHTDNSLTLVNAATNVTTGFLVGRLANTVDNQTFAALDFNRPYLAARTVLAGMGMWTLGGSGITAAAIPISGLHGVATAYDGFTISCAAAITGSLRVYGYRNS